MLGRVVVLHLVATDTFGFRRGKVPLVTGRTLCDGFVATLQLEAGGEVVERGWFPTRRGMARGALFGDARSHMARKNSLCVARGVATVAGRWRPRKGGHMAGGTKDRGMFARQREAGRCVVETAVEPVGFRMALGTVQRVAQLQMLGSGVVLGLVATYTFGFGRGKVPLVTGRTLCDGFVATLQLEAGGEVVERGRFPARRGMARGALFWDARSHMAR